MSSSTAATNLAGEWFGELAAAVHGTWHAVVASHGDPGPRQKLLAGEKKRTTAVQGASAAAGRKARKERDHTGRRGDGDGAMSDATVYLLLDRFAPS